MSFMKRMRLSCRFIGLVAMTTLGAFQPTSGFAQSIPGLIVSVPPDNSGGSNQQQGTLGSGGQQGSGPDNPLLKGAVGNTAPRQQAAPARPAKKVSPKKKSASLSRGTSKPKRSRKRRAKPAGVSARRKHSVAILVNDEPITHHEIDQRSRLLSLGGKLGNRVQANFKALIKRKSTNDRLRSILKETIAANPGKSRDAVLAIFEKRKRTFAKRLQQQALRSARSQMIPRFKQAAKNELIEERLKMQEAKRLKALASQSAVDATIGNIAKRNKVSTKQFLANIQRSGVGKATFKDKIRAQLSWTGVVRRKFSRSVAFNMKDIDREVGNAANNGGGVTLKLHQISLSLPASGLKQSVMAARLREAEVVQRKFSGCAQTKVLAGSVRNAIFKDLGTVKPSTIAEPTRSMLLQARNGQMLPPVISGRGVVLYAVCGRDAAGGKQKARNNARAQLRQREFQVMGRRHLADLKRDAHIEYR